MSSKRMKHYPIPDLTDSELKRFWSKVDRSGDCWEWTAGTTKGYGRIRINDVLYLANRISYALVHGDPGDLWVCHTCDNPPCVNPDHLWLGTCRDNLQDAAKKERCVTKLSVSDVQEILESNDLQQTLADKYGVNRTIISDIQCRKRWRYLEGSPRIDAAMGNSQTGVRGVSPVGSQYRATIMFKSVRYSLGYFDTVEEAEQAVTKKRLELRELR